MRRFLIAGLMGGCAGSAFAGWQLTDLGTLGGSSSHALSINAKGQVVGYSDNANGVQKAFLYERGRMIDIGRPDASKATATSINDAGQVAGSIQRPGSPWHAFVYRNGSMTELPANDDPAIASAGNAINNRGQVAGSRKERATLFEHGAAIDLGALGNASYALGINDRGDIVGASDTKGTRSKRAVLYRDGKVIELGIMGPAGPMSAFSFSAASAINIHGVAVGTGSTKQGLDSHAILFKDGQMQDLGTLGGKTSSASNINDHEQIVGSSQIANGTSHAFLYQNGRMIDLAAIPEAVAAGFLLSSAAAINNAGQIVGSGIVKGKQHAYLLTPTPSNGYLKSPFGPAGWYRR